MHRLFSILILCIPFLIKAQVPDYPPSDKTPVNDTFFNTLVTDEYRWLENTNDPKVQDWVNLQNSLTAKELRNASFKVNSYTAIDRYSYVVYDNPIKHGDYYFTHAYYNNVGSPALFCQESLRGNATILVDPNFISSKDNINIKGYSVSLDSKLLAFQYSRNGSDWGEIKVINIKTGAYKNDHLKNIKYSNIAWKDDGFYYSRFPQQEFEKTVGQEVYYHKIGTPQEQDMLIFRRVNNPEVYFFAMTTSDERFFILEETFENKGIRNFFYIDFNDSSKVLKPLLTNLKISDNLTILDNDGDSLIAKTFKGGNNGMLVRINPASPRAWEVIVPEYKTALLLNVTLLQDRIITLYQTNRKQQIVSYDYQGKLLNILQLPFGFSVNGLSGEKNDKQLSFSYNGYTQPTIVYVLDVESFEIKPLGTTVVNFDYTQFETKELEYKSFDGTIVPLYLIYKKGLILKNQNPVLLSAYGGFGIVSSPGFEPGIVHFLSEGGIYAFANIRGGGDYGVDWALQGRGRNKQNSFGDFIAAAEFLIDNEYTNCKKLAITGSSNGGLVVGAAMTQRPELFRVAVPIVAPLDIIRLENFTIGYRNTDEYGSIHDSIDFFNILAYSPLHSIKEDVNYPATMILTSENDDRVPPFNSYKFAAKLQNRKAQTNPVLLRVEKNAGHYGGTASFKTRLKEEADIYDFIMFHLGSDKN